MARLPLYGDDGTVRAYAIVDDADFERLNQWRWSLSGDGEYATRKETIYLHQQVFGSVEEGLEIDHTDGNKLDYRKDNLRAVTHQQNLQNRTHLNANNTSGHRGVTWHKQMRKWQAQCVIGGKHHFIGLFERIEEAAEAVSAFRREHMPHSFADQP